MTDDALYMLIRNAWPKIEGRHDFPMNEMFFIMQGLMMAMASVLLLVPLVVALLVTITGEDNEALFPELYSALGALKFFSTDNKISEKQEIFHIGKNDTNEILWSDIPNVSNNLNSKVNIAKLIRHEAHPEYIIFFILIIGLDLISIIPFALLRQRNQAIKFATIKTINIDALQITTELLGAGAVIAEKIEADAIDASHIKADELFVGVGIESNSYVANTAGFKINYDGTAEFNNNVTMNNKLLVMMIESFIS